MSQNLISLTLTDEQLAAADQALDALEGVFAQLVALDGDERKVTSSPHLVRSELENPAFWLGANPAANSLGVMSPSEECVRK